MSQNDEDDDYMSDKFLAQSGSERPGLTFNPATKRKHELAEKHAEANAKSRIRPTRVVEAEQRERGLQQAIEPTNVGFQLLQKMGYKPGTGLGKEGRAGRVEPVPINIKAGREGLGREEFILQKRSEIGRMKSRMQQRRQELISQTKDEFINMQRNKALAKQTERDLYSSQKSCQQLDQTMGLEEPVEPWFWPLEIKPVANDSSDSENSSDEEEEKEEFKLEPTEKLEILTDYLRTSHYFCVWCGISYEDQEDLQQCPGKTADDH